MIKRFVIAAVVALVVIVGAVAIYIHTKSSPSAQTPATSQPAQQTAPLTASTCGAAAQAYEKQYQADEKASGKVITSFSTPQVHYNTKLKACLVLVGVAYKDNTGVSEDVWVVEVSSGHAILKWSNASKYFDDAGPTNYVDPSTEGIITYTPTFQAKAGEYMSQ